MDSRHAIPATLVTTVRHGQGRRWLSRWVDHDGNERSKAFDRKEQAKAHHAQVSADLTTGSYVDPRRGVVTFGQIAKEWLRNKEPTLKPATYAEYRSVLDAVVLPRWADVAVKDIDHQSIQSWVTWMSTNTDARTRKARENTAYPGLSPARVIHAYQAVQQVLALALRQKMIAGNPTDGVELPRKRPAEKIALTHEQVRQLADAAGEMRVMVYTLAYGGFRYGEAAALRVGDVDVKRRRIRVSRSVTGVARMGLVETGTKTHESRVVPLPPFVMDMVADHIAGRGPEQLVFNHNGTWLHLDRFRKYGFNDARTTVGMPGITPHTLRHTAGSLALASGATVTTVQKLLGHKSALTTMGTYAHMLPDDFDNLAAAMDAAARPEASLAK